MRSRSAASVRAVSSRARVFSLLLELPGLGDVERDPREAFGSGVRAAQQAGAGEDPADSSVRVDHAVLRLELPPFLNGPLQPFIDCRVIVGMDGLEVLLVGGLRVLR